MAEEKYCTGSACRYARGSVRVGTHCRDPRPPFPPFLGLRIGHAIHSLSHSEATVTEMEGTSEHFFSITDVPEELERYLVKVRAFVAKHAATGTPIVLVTVRLLPLSLLTI